MRRAVLADADAVVCEYVDGAELHQSGEPYRRAQVIGEDQKRRSEWNDAAMCRHAIARCAHAVLAHPKVQVASGVIAASARQALALRKIALGIFEVTQIAQGSERRR